MTGWTTFSFDVTSAEEYDGELTPLSHSDTLAELLCESLDDLGIFTTIRHTYQEVYARVVEYREWYEDERVLEDVIDVWDRACIVQANDTTDTGTARMYEHFEDYGVPYLIETYREMEDRDGINMGAVAAGYMTYKHKFPVEHYRPKRGWEYE